MTAPERQPFSALADRELELVVTALTGEAVRHTDDFGLECARLAESAWQELKARRADKPRSADTARCRHFVTSPPGLTHLFRPIHCEGLFGHDGPHFSTSKHGARRDWP